MSLFRREVKILFSYLDCKRGFIRIEGVGGKEILFLRKRGLFIQWLYLLVEKGSLNKQGC